MADRFRTCLASLTGAVSLERQLRLLIRLLRIEIGNACGTRSCTAYWWTTSSVPVLEGATHGRPLGGAARQVCHDIWAGFREWRSSPDCTSRGSIRLRRCVGRKLPKHTQSCYDDGDE